MKAKIHRGADEVGGSCVELLAESGDRVVLDLGLPLSAESEDELALPPIAGLDGGDPTLRAVLVSHGRPDHFGLVSSISSDVPLYMGAAASRILREAAFFTPLGLDREPDGSFSDRRPIETGSFTVTPYLIDHSAFDSYALLVEADGTVSSTPRTFGHTAAREDRSSACSRTRRPKSTRCSSRGRPSAGQAGPA